MLMFMFGVKHAFWKHAKVCVLPKRKKQKARPKGVNLKVRCYMLLGHFFFWSVSKKTIFPSAVPVEWC